MHVHVALLKLKKTVHDVYTCYPHILIMYTYVLCKLNKLLPWLSTEEIISDVSVDETLKICKLYNDSCCKIS